MSFKISSITEHNLTDLEFKKFCKREPFSDWRQVSKGINFSTIFGCSPNRLADVIENNGFTEQKCDEYIKLANLQDEYNNLLAAKMGKMEIKKIKLLVCATAMHRSFFKTYSGLMDRINRESAFAKKHGYVRAWHGPVRRLPEFRYFNYNADGNVIGADKKEFSGLISNLTNISVNSTVQTMEARVAFGTISSICHYLRKWKLKTYVWNGVHDSIDACVYKPEAELFIALAKECAAWKREPFYDVPMSLDCQLADLSKGLEHNYYKAGIELEGIPLQDAIDNWNKAHEKELGFEKIYWEGCPI